MSATQHNEVKDALGSSGWLGNFLGSLAGVHLAPADPEVMAVVSQHLRADKSARNQVGSLYLRCGFCSPMESVLSFLFPLSLSVTRLLVRGTFFARSCGQPAVQPSVHSFAPLLSSLPSALSFRSGSLFVLMLWRRFAAQSLLQSPGLFLWLKAVCSHAQQPP